MCRKGDKCIPVAKICDGRQDCEEAEDEENCGNVAEEIWLVGEKSQPKRNENFTLKCVAKGSADLGLSIHWFKRGRRESVNITDKLAPQKTSSDDVHIKDMNRPSDANLYIEEHRSGNRVVSFLRFAPVGSQNDGDYYCTSGTLSSSDYQLQAIFDDPSCEKYLACIDLINLPPNAETRFPADRNFFLSPCARKSNNFRRCKDQHSPACKSSIYRHYMGRLEWFAADYCQHRVIWRFEMNLCWKANEIHRKMENLMQKRCFKDTSSPFALSCKEHEETEVCLRDIIHEHCGLDVASYFRYIYKEIQKFPNSRLKCPRRKSFICIVIISITYALGSSLTKKCFAIYRICVR
ncbi:hypothetical protein ElyMa_004976800 [Elysia marginata]|uniref:Ig-like domain-containing protein n=1 Tax=Elysia marginata TaxID=1093978 RepID=A0AAV4J8E5_9GAST|nr:hypothetical protein ElyMa_004976800 [Elysia marginata]